MIVLNIININNESHNPWFSNVLVRYTDNIIKEDTDIIIAFLISLVCVDR